MVHCPGFALNDNIIPCTVLQLFLVGVLGAAGRESFVWQMASANMCFLILKTNMCFLILKNHNQAGFFQNHNQANLDTSL